METTDKHAYCIMAHDNWPQLQMLIDLLDDEKNDIYLHIDKKALNSYRQYGGASTKRSPLILVESHDVRWGDYSAIITELSIFQRVVGSKVEYERVHLISGSDIPLHNQDYIHEFFKGKKDEYLIVKTTDDFLIRIKYYHFFVRWIRKYKMFNLLRRALLLVQMPFVDRMKHCPLPFAWGANWCSLTMRAVRCLCENKAVCDKLFKYSTGSDELYKQMILASNPDFSFSPESDGNLRYVDFSQHLPSPKILTMEDYGKIKDSRCLFARKFDIRKDRQIVDKIIGEVRKT